MRLEPKPGAHDRKGAVAQKVYTSFWGQILTSVPW